MVDFLISWVSSQEDLTTSDGKARAVSTLAEPIARIGNQTLKHLLVKETAEKLAIDERTLLQIVGKIGRPRSAKTQEPPPGTFDPRPRSERELLIQMMTDSATVIEQEVRFCTSADARVERTKPKEPKHDETHRDG